ncbi:ribonuclease D [Geobacter sp. AOG1]|uniref:ribonuclease D n=1 Tax=Geobacter sp. AOG1 TaxID=1566346 RepID=UPI001CC3E355|nr:ribonuclease D [Geobacter sp. AOG1]GFE56910.1 ribonuclease D [Geobacter sp. AOG1]
MTFAESAGAEAGSSHQTANFIGIITSREALLDLVGRMEQEPVLAFDLEADSLHHYTEKVCLIQVATPTESALIDPLALPDLSPLASVLANPSIHKVFHGADYDIRSLHRDFGLEVNSLFDTMIACQLLGEAEVGLAAVLKRRFGVELDKGFQKADWSRRPLSGEMIAYAVQDTTLLIPLCQQLEAELRGRGRLAWVEEECRLLSRVRTVPRDQEPLCFRFKGAARMEPRTLAVLEELLRFRDHQARRQDVPPFKVLGTDVIRALAEGQPRTMEELAALPGFPTKLLTRLGSGIIQAVIRGMALPPDKFPRFPRQQRQVLDKGQQVILQRLKKVREAKARELGIDAGLLINNSLLESLAVADRTREARQTALAALKGWQREVLAADLAALMEA